MENDIVYKYSDWNDYSKDALEKRYFWFSKPTNFNDPFDSNMDILRAFNGAKNIFTQNKKPENELLLDFVKRKTKDFGILCLTKPTEKGKTGDKGFNNLHFWSHYANSHRGISIGYDAKEIENYYSEKLFCNSPLTKVNYFEEPVDIDSYDFTISQDENGTTTKRIDGIFGLYKDDKNEDLFFEQILLFKDKRIWGLENEFRIILAGLAQNNMRSMQLFSATNFGIIAPNGYRLPYPEKEIIKEVTFGVNFDNENIENAIELISRNNKNIKYFTSELDFVGAYQIVVFFYNV
ncbi:DUF2971 domain-containing protein [Reichenbachiella sp. MALMAid0571]|uniref:DUF2971 domain-containing protein n=1 Tax=Reichenbachiella sp. MALMAid0571 TaxID=3143939 RepID=UPI0032DF17F3